MSATPKDFDVVPFSSLDAETQDLIRNAVAVRQLAYCPYSNFQVGAALLCDDGKVYTGCNVENAAYGPTICAERTAVVKAVSSGNRVFRAIAVTADNGDNFISPCGPCRQVLCEFGITLTVYLAKPELTDVMITSLASLLPLHFGP